MGERKVGVEEGELSESASLAEITEEDFGSKKPEDQEEEIVVVSDPNPKQSSSDPRVWTMQDLYKYGPGYARGLYNFAWAQAVQNKPLPTSSPTVIENHTNNSTNNDRGSTIKNDSGDDENEIMDVVMEDEDIVQDMELEEGEIDLDSDVVIKNNEEVETSNAVIDNDGHVDTDGNANKNDQLGVTEMTNGLSSSCNELLSSLRKDLEKVEFDEAKKSFGAVCLLLLSALERTQVLGLEVQDKDELVQLAFSAVQVVFSVFCAMNQKDKEHNKESFSRLISLTTSQDPFLFNPEQLNEIKVMMSSLSTTGFLCNKVSNPEKDKSLVDGKLKSCGSSLGKNKPSIFTEALKSEVSAIRVRGGQAPLLDLHKDHDTDSLPSPTSKSANPLFAPKAMTDGDGMVKPEIAMVRMPPVNKSSMIRTYETEALNAVSTYQQKFARTSVFASDRLPSPTPSDEGDSGDADTTSEVSSSYFGTKINDIGPPNLSKPAVKFVPSNDGSDGVVPSNPLTSLTSSAPQPSLKVSSKSRDPRLRFTGSDSAKMELNRRPSPTVNSRISDPFEDPTVLKKPKTVTSGGSLADVKRVDGGWSEDIGSKYQFDNTRIDPRKMATGMVSSTTVNAKPAVTTCATELPVTSIAASLPCLWKEFALNPTMLLDPTKLLDIIQKGQRSSLSEEANPLSRNPSISTSNDLSSSSVPGAVFSMNVSPSKLSAVGKKPKVVLSTPSQVDFTDPGKFRMKPRDPRRVLHQINKIQTSESLGSKQSRVNATSTLGSQGSKDILNLQKKEDQKIAQSLPSTVAAPDIARQFTKSLENIAGIMSSQTATTSSVSVTPTSLKEEVNATNVNGRVAEVKEQNGGVGSKPEVTAVTSHPHAWGDVEHLFDGYDDHQLAAIQKERARRIEEQKKMFAARKLCLVLDLDHTLLNSAKFVEVDPAHDEILRKKEEQDREKPDRHLFRFPHMGMWTKLRPGIWNFLEKASKLYELHLYTMGNKLYASEMAKVLDPKGVLFSGRVISRGDDGDLFDGEERIPKSKDLEGVLGMESAVVIIDDSVKVWPHNKLNLIVVERYIYFPCSRRQFALPGPSLLEIDHDERPEDGTLASSLAVIERIHQNFFSNRILDEVDVRNILASEQQKILAGCRIVFSRVIPVGSNPHLNQLWQTAEQFGAVCTNQLDDAVTHVVANSLGTDKVNWGLSTGKHVVYPGWVEASALLYRRANEQDFAIKP